jgi:hypothetical protein
MTAQAFFAPSPASGVIMIRDLPVTPARLCALIVAAEARP